MIKLEHFRVFVRVAETKSLAEAADILGRTPSAISMTLKQMEDILGGSLFAGERKSTLTPLGKYVSDRARSVVREHEKTLADVLRYSRGEEGIIRVVAVPTAAKKILPVAVEEFRRSHSNLRMEIRDTDSSGVALAVTESAVDFGIASKSALADGLVAELLTTDEFVLVCRHDHPLTQIDRPIRWKELLGYDFIANGLCKQIETAEMQTLITDSKLFLYNVTTLNAFVERGFGITVLPRMSIEDSNSLKALELEDTGAKRHLYLFRRPNETLSPTAEHFIKELLSGTGH